jgi:hypothetical protein
MLGTTHIGQTAGAAALAAAVAIFAVPVALAGGEARLGAQHGRYDRTAALAQQHQPQTLIDGQSPDTRDAAAEARLLALTPSDGRSPDTIDAAFQAHLPTVTIFRSSGFAWDDFGIGIGAALGLVLIVTVSVFTMTRLGSRRTNPVATA